MTNRFLILLAVCLLPIIGFAKSDIENSVDWKSLDSSVIFKNYDKSKWLDIPLNPCDQLTISYIETDSLYAGFMIGSAVDLVPSFFILEKANNHFWLFNKQPSGIIKQSGQLLQNLDEVIFVNDRCDLMSVRLNYFINKSTSSAEIYRYTKQRGYKSRKVIFDKVSYPSFTSVETLEGVFRKFKVDLSMIEHLKSSEGENLTKLNGYEKDVVALSGCKEGK